LVATTTRRTPLSDEPPARRSVHDFCKHYGLSRPQFLEARAKAQVTTKDWDSMLSAKDQDALVRHMSVEKRANQAMRRIREQPRVTKQFAPPPERQPEPEIDYEAEIEAEIHRISDSLSKWRTALIELADGHAAVDGKGRCRRCHEVAPCGTKQALSRLDNELVEEIAVVDTGDLEGSAPNEPLPYAVLEGKLRQLYDARNRWMRALTELTIDHMLEDAKGRCTQCGVKAPCDTKKAVMRINRGIARQLETFAAMDDGELDAALGNRRKTDSYYQDEDDEDWDAI
jgi:hypothetical protein